jgi:hypothetical protein
MSFKGCAMTVKISFENYSDYERATVSLTMSQNFGGRLLA